MIGSVDRDTAAMQTRYDNAYVLNVLADDHPGIVAAVGSAVAALGGNIDACSQTVLKGYFTLIMVVSVADEIDPAALAEEVRQRGPGLQVLAVRLEGAGEGAPSGLERFVITAFGLDKPGIIHRFTQYLAGKDINILDLYGGRTGDDFVLISQVEIPARWEINMLQADLEQIGGEEGFTVRLQHEDIFVATNQLRLSRRDG